MLDDENSLAVAAQVYGGVRDGRRIRFKKRYFSPLQGRASLEILQHWRVVSLAGETRLESSLISHSLCNLTPVNNGLIDHERIISLSAYDLQCVLTFHKDALLNHIHP